MPRLLSALVICLLVSCSPPAPPSNEFSDTRDYAEKFADQPQEDNTEVQVPLEVKVQRFDSLLQFFDAFNNFNGGSAYLHHSLTKQYCRNENALVVVVADAGPVLFSCRNHDKLIWQQDSVVVRIGNKTFTCRNGEVFPPSQDSYEGDCTQYDGDDVYPMIEAISAHKNDIITVQVFGFRHDNEPYVLQQRDKEALYQSALLLENYVYAAVR